MQRIAFIVLHVVVLSLSSVVLAQDTDLDAAALQELVGQFKALVKRETGKDFPQDVQEQLWGAIGAVFNSWMGKRAIDYRREFKITPDMANGTAVNIQTMVFGNMGDNSATGVAMSRNASTGEKQLEGDYLINAQGEDVVAGEVAHLRRYLDPVDGKCLGLALGQLHQKKDDIDADEGVVDHRDGL